MPSKDLTFRIFGEDVNASLALRNIAAEADKSARGISKSFGALPMVVTAVFAVATLASVKLAADFQVATTQLVTGAGESEKNLAKVKDGLLKLAPAVGMGPTALAKAMFLVESAGFHGAAGLDVMRAAAEGAKIGGADATTVANALTTAMVDYNLPAKDAAKVTSELVATVSAGKTNMQDLAGALSVVAKPASAAGISMQQMLGAMGTMTQQGVSAQQAGQDLAATIAALSNPTAVQTGAMAQMGLSSIDVAKNLGKNGLSGTFETLSGAIFKHMGPSGLVLQSSFNQSKLAAASAQEMLDRLPKSLQGLGKEFLDNQITQKEWTKALKGQDVLTSNLGKEFATTAKTANGFSDSLRGGGGSAKTFNGLLADMTGGQTGLATGLALTGPHMGTFKQNVKDIGGASVEAGKHVKGWAETQKDFRVQVEQASGGVQAMGIKIGTALLPMLSSALKIGKEWTDSLTKNKPELYAIIGVVGAFAAIMVVAFVAQQTFTVVSGVARAALGIATAAQWLFNAALSANPIGLIILAIAALVAGLIWFFTQTKLGKEVWQNMVTAIGVAWNWLWNSVIKPVGDWISAAFKTIGSVAGAIFGGIGDLIGGVFNGVVGIVRGAINIMIDLINGMIGNINGIGGAFSAVTGGAVNIKVGRIPRLATGGTYTAGGLAMVGENGPEIVKLPGGATVFPNGTKMGGGGGGGTYISFNISGIAASDKAAMARLMQDAWTSAVKTGAVPSKGLIVA